MSINLENPFNTLLNLKYRNVTISRPGSTTLTATYNIKVTPSNYSRNLSAPEEIAITGKEFIISKHLLDSVGFPTPKRGDRIYDEVLGLDIISEVEPMSGLGDSIIGFRVRTS